MARFQTCHSQPIPYKGTEEYRIYPTYLALR